MSNLPYDSRVEYIESTGTQYINTGITPTATTKIIFNFVNLQASGDAIIGYQESTDKNDWRFFNYNQTAYFDTYGGTAASGTRISGGTISVGYAYALEMGNYYIKNLETGTNIISGTAYTGIGHNYIYINGNQTPSKNRWYFIQIYDNNELVRNYIPVRVGQVGYLYDKVSGQLFGNDGTGDFVVGPDKVVVEEGGHVPMLGRRVLMNVHIDFSKYAVHIAKNAPVMAVCYAQGWAANERYMTFEEAAAVTNAQLNTAFAKNKNITHFEEFKYFTNITVINTTTGDNSGFNECSNLSVIELPQTITRLGYYSFSRTGLISIELPNSINAVNVGGYNWVFNSGAFESCSKLTSCKFSSGLNYIASRMFLGSAISQITNYNHITKIGACAFQNCKNLASFTIPAGVDNIGSKQAAGGWGADSGNTFNGCTSLDTIICLPTTPPTLNGSSNFPTTCTIYVPDASLSAYQAATGWSDIASQIKAMSELPS